MEAHDMFLIQVWFSFGLGLFSYLEDTSKGKDGIEAHDIFVAFDLVSDGGHVHELSFFRREDDVIGVEYRGVPSRRLKEKRQCPRAFTM